MNLSVEHVLMIVLVAFALHYLMQNCGCRQVEGVSINNRKEGDCCDFGECGDGLECNITAMTKKCMWEPGKIWDGVCQKETHWFEDAVLPTIRNKSEGKCCNMGECGDGLECNATAMTKKCMWEPGRDWYGVCQKETHWFADAGGGMPVVTD